MKSLGGFLEHVPNGTRACMLHAVFTLNPAC
jgi:hypothetical protein